MKFSRPAAVFAAVVLLAGGAAFAVAATTTNPVTLCANAKNGAITLPASNGTCAKGTTAFQVASASDVQALAGRLDTAEGTLASQGTRLGTAEGTLASYGTRLGDVEGALGSLETRLGNVESANTSQNNDIAALANDFEALDALVRLMNPTALTVATPNGTGSGFFSVDLKGKRLMPGTPVIWHFTIAGNAKITEQKGVVSDEGTIETRIVGFCGDWNMYATTVTVYGDPITSNVISPDGPSCD